MSSSLQGANGKGGRVGNKCCIQAAPSNSESKIIRMGFYTVYAKPPKPVTGPDEGSSYTHRPRMACR